MPIEQKQPTNPTFKARAFSDFESGNPFVFGFLIMAVTIILSTAIYTCMIFLSAEFQLLKLYGAAKQYVIFSIPLALTPMVHEILKQRKDVDAYSKAKKIAFGAAVCAVLFISTPIIFANPIEAWLECQGRITLDGFEPAKTAACQRLNS